MIVYGGEIVLTKKAVGYAAKITLTHQLYTLTGSIDENWGILNEGDASQRFRLQPKYDGMVLVSTTHFQLTNTNTANWGYCRFANYYFIITDSDNQIGSVENLRTWLATQNTNGTPLSILVELATPIEIDLTDASDIVALVGTNNVWSDTGDMEVQYKKII